MTVNIATNVLDFMNLFTLNLKICVPSTPYILQFISGHVLSDLLKW